MIDMVLKQELSSYFRRHIDQYDELRQIINSKSNSSKPDLPSLRGLEYVITYLSRHKGGQGFYTDANGERMYVDIHNMYKTTLGTHGKKRFDSFRRTELISFCVNGREDAPILTTIGQLWWGKWIYEMGIMLFIKKNWLEVRKDMAKTLKLQRKRDKKSPKKRKIFPQQIHANDIVIKFM